MKYDKPEVVAFGSAADAVRSTDKGTPIIQELRSPFLPAATVMTYEADE
jgi:hypothetical protein